MTFEELDKILENSQYAPFILSLSEAGDNELTVKLAASCIGECTEVTEENEPNTQLREILNRSKPLILDSRCIYEITFEGYIIYQICNESFYSGNPNDVFSGRFLRIYEKSFLLDNLSQMTDAQELDNGSYYPAKWAHYGIVALNHIIDVVSTNNPIVNFETSS